MTRTIYLKLDLQYVFVHVDDAPPAPTGDLIQFIAGQPFRIYSTLLWLPGAVIDDDLVSNGSPEEANPIHQGIDPDAWLRVSVRLIAVDFTFDASDPRLLEVAPDERGLPDYIWLGGAYHELFTAGDDGYSGWGGALMQKLLWDDPAGVYDGRELFYDALAGNDTVSLPDAAKAAEIGFDRSIFFKGGAGNDLIYGHEEADRIQGDADADTLDGGAGADTLLGGDGADSLEGNLGADSMVGGNGDDTYIVDDLGDRILEATGPGSGADHVIAYANHTLSQGVEHLTLVSPGGIYGVGLAGTGNGLGNRIMANYGADTLNGGAGSDTLSGGEGDDSLNGGTGADSMDGGAGNDVYVVDDPFDVVVEAADGGVDTVRALVSHTLAAGVENMAMLGAAQILGTGNALANVITGNAVENTLNGAEGADTLIGGSGDDRYHVDDPGDLLVEKGGGGLYDTVWTVINLVLPAQIEQLVVIGDSGLAVTGNSLANYMIGGGQADTLNGGGGADTLVGGGGNDLFIVDAADQIWDGPDQGIDLVRTAFDRALPNFIENLTIYGTVGRNGSGNGLANAINGGSGADTLLGLGGIDRLNGGAGNDSLNGGAELDILTGGAGADTFTFANPAEAGDLISDFATGLDRLVVSAVSFGGGLVAGQLSAARFTANDAGTATAAIGQFIHETDAARLWWDPNGTDPGGRVLVARLAGLAIDATDIWVT